MKFICFKTTTDDKKIANAICETAVSKGYSPCTSIKKIESNYIWNEKNVKSDEYHIEIKSIEKFSNYIVALIKKNSNYTVPEITSNYINIHNDEYKNWYLKCLNQ